MKGASVTVKMACFPINTILLTTFLFLSSEAGCISPAHPAQHHSQAHSKPHVLISLALLSTTPSISSSPFK